MSYTCVRWDCDHKKYAVTFEEQEEPQPIGIRGYWFPTQEAALIFAKAQKQDVVVVEKPD